MILLAISTVATLYADSQTADAKAKYNHKFATVLKDGLVVGYCSGTTFEGIDVGSTGHYVNLGIDDNGIRGSRFSNVFKCPTQPIHKGDVLSILDVRTSKQGRTIALSAAAVPHSLTRGIGAFEHQSIETGYITLIFGSHGDADALVSEWLRLSDTAALDKLGNTASFVEVKQVKLGMSFTEVEQAARYSHY